MPDVTQPDHRGWGAWPGPAGSDAAKRFEHAAIVTIHPLSKRPELALRVHRDVAAPVGHFLSHLEAIHDLNHQADDWGFSIRANKNDPSSPSWHSWGIAVDLDAAQNPNGSMHTTFPVTETRALAHAFGFRWGFDYHSTKDPMHFEYCGTRADAQYATWYMAQTPQIQKRHGKPYTFPG